jgi:hypothetical protein
MIKDIIVNLSVTKNDCAVANYATSVLLPLCIRIKGIDQRRILELARGSS